MTSTSPIKLTRAAPVYDLLDNRTISLVKGMLARGDRQSDIAAFFGLNEGRVAEINRHQRGARVHTAKPDELPPPGPYLAPVAVAEFRSALNRIQHELTAMTVKLNDMERQRRG